MKTAKELRYQLYKSGWKKNAKEAANNTCYISNKTDELEVHHANYSFSECMCEAHQVLGLEYHKNAEDYNPEDLKALTDKVLELHEKSIAVVLHKDVHKQLHDIYGKHVDMNQIETFKAEYINNLGGR